MSSQLIVHSRSYQSTKTSLNPSIMQYGTIKDGESTPLQEGGYSDDGTSTSAAPNTTNKHTRSAIIRALMVGTTVGTLLLMMAGHSKMLARSSNVDGLVAVSSTARQPPGTPLALVASGMPTPAPFDPSALGGMRGIAAPFPTVDTRADFNMLLSIETRQLPSLDTDLSGCHIQVRSKQIAAASPDCARYFRPVEGEFCYRFALFVGQQDPPSETVCPINAAIEEIIEAANNGEYSETSIGDIRNAEVVKFVTTAAPKPTPAAPERTDPTTNENLERIPDLANLMGYTTFVEALVATDLVDTLSNPGPFTVFAPTNTAFDTLGPELLGCLFEDQFSGSLQAVLEYHVTTGEFLSEDLSNNQVIRMLNGEDILIKIEADGTFVIYVVFSSVHNNADVESANLKASNGVLQGINRVLLPPDFDVPAFLRECNGIKPPTRSPTRPQTISPTADPNTSVVQGLALPKDISTVQDFDDAVIDKTLSILSESCFVVVDANQVRVDDLEQLCEQFFTPDQLLGVEFCYDFAIIIFNGPGADCKDNAAAEIVLAALEAGEYEKTIGPVNELEITQFAPTDSPTMAPTKKLTNPPSTTSARTTGTPSLSTYNVSFRNGREGWYTSNNDVLRAEGNSANPNFYLHADLLSWGISFQNSVHHKFVGDFFEKGVVELGLDMRVNSILLDGFEVASNLVLTLEDDTGVGVYFTSERDLERDTAMTRPVFSTFSFSIPLQEDFPTGWKGYDTGVNPPFPAGRTYGSVLRNVRRISFTTHQPGFGYGDMRFDIDADNVFISSKENV